MLALDLGIFNKTDHVVSPAQATKWTLIWVGLALLFAFVIYNFGENIHGINSVAQVKEVTSKYGQPTPIDTTDAGALHSYRKQLTLEFLTGYLVEESLSIDNLFIILLIFTAFSVHRKLYHRVLFWGILGAVIFRCIFIFLGAFLLSQFAWVMYIFAGFLVFTGVRMFINRNKPEEIDTKSHPVVKFCSRYFRVTKEFEGNKFSVKRNGKKFITPLLIVLLLIEFSDVLFAVDSIPAIFAVTKDPYIVFFSNIFAILGLRSLFFLVAELIHKFHFFKHGLSVLLVFIGVKMILEDKLKEIGFNITHSLLVIVFVILSSIALSLVFPEKKAENR